jgi:hypothetical protein
MMMIPVLGFSKSNSRSYLCKLLQRRIFLKVIIEAGTLKPRMFVSELQKQCVDLFQPLVSHYICKHALQLNVCPVIVNIRILMKSIPVASVTMRCTKNM